jgi:hypothetical protein
MKDILNDLLICAGEIGSIVWMDMKDDHMGLQVVSSKDGVIYEFYITKKEAKKDA